MYLAIYDISGIQKFIFATSKLREQVGGSNIVHNILYELLPKVLGEYKNNGDWSWKENKKIFDFEEKDYNIVYIGGGNSMVLYKSYSGMMHKTADMEKEVLIWTGCELKLCHAFIDLDSDENKSKNYLDLYNELMKRLAVVKNTPSEIKLASGFAINEYHPVTLEPITLVDVNEKKKVYGVANHITKREAFNKDKEVNFEGLEFANQFEQFRSQDRKSFVAVVHIDGDSMGKQIQRVMNKIGNTPDLEESMLKMRDISMAIGSLYIETMKKSLENFYIKDREQGVKKELAFRKIISDGDDITFIISAENAFDFVEEFMENLDTISKENSVLQQYDFKVSASAGIVFVHDKYPFDEAYDLAEQLCKSAKSVKKDRDDEYRHISSMDFHILSAGIRTGIEAFRAMNYKKINTVVTKGFNFLNIRPYFFDHKVNPNSYNSFKKLRKEIKSPNAIARSKLKGLRNAYGEGYETANSYYKFILSRDKQGIDNREKAFYDEDWEFRACFFDALDSMDV